MNTLRCQSFLMYIALMFTVTIVYGQDPSAIADFESSNQGLLIPRTDTTSVNNAFTPATGLIIYQTSDHTFYYYNGMRWKVLGEGAGDNLGNHMAEENIQLKGFLITNQGEDKGIMVNNEGGVSLGTSNTSNRFDVYSDSSFLSQVNDISITGTGMPLPVSSTTSGAQTFTVDTTGFLSKIEILAKDINALGDKIEIQIKTGNDPSAGTGLASDTIIINSFTDSVYCVNLNSGIAVTKNDALLVIVTYVSGDNMEWQRSSTDIYTGGQAFVYAGGWISQPGKDHWLKTYVDVPDQQEVSVFTVTSDLNAGIGTSTPDVSAALDVTSTSKGFLLPRMTTAQINDIPAPSIGLQVYNLENGCFYIYNGNKWVMDCPLDFQSTSQAPCTFQWELLSDSIIPPRTYASGFVNGTAAFVGTGFASTALKDFYKYDFETELWELVDSFPGSGRFSATSFALGGFGYVGTGWDGAARSDFYRYNPETDNWMAIASLPVARRGAVSFTINDTAYVGTGGLNTSINGGSRDFYKYDQAMDTWLPIDSFPGLARWGASAFVIDNKAYVGLGRGGGVAQHADFYQYNPSTGNWTQIDSFPGEARYDASSFSLSGKGFVGLGWKGVAPYYEDAYLYDPVMNSWEEIDSFPGGARHGSVGFSHEDIGYICTGTGGMTLDDFYQLRPQDYFMGIDKAGRTKWYGSSFSDILNDDNNAGSNKISGLMDPSAPQDAATKNYVDGHWEIDSGNMSNSNSGNTSVSGILYIDALNNRVGIGTPTPFFKLDVNGTSNLTGDVTMSTSRIVDGPYALDLDGQSWFNDLILYGDFEVAGPSILTGDVTMNTSRIVDGPYALDLDGQSWFNDLIVYGGFEVVGPSIFVNETTYDVGFGTTSPSAKIHLVSNGTSIGDGLRITSASGNNDDWYFYTDGSNNLTIRDDQANLMTFEDGTSSVGINTTNPDANLSVSGTASKTGGGSWSTLSDRRVKRDVRDFNDGLETLLKIRPVKYKFKSGFGIVHHPDKEFVGVIAQDIKDVIPYMVDSYTLESPQPTEVDPYNPDSKNNTVQPHIAQGTELLTYDPSALDYIIINAIKEIYSTINYKTYSDKQDHETRLVKIENENAKLKTELQALQKLVHKLLEDR